MWKAAFGGRSERGSTVGVDDTASTSSRRRRHRSSTDDKSIVSSTSRRTERDSDKKRHSRHESGVSYGSAPIPRLTESAVNAFNANDDDDDIWEDEADLKSERRSKRSDSHERRRRKSSGRSERSRSRERDSRHKKSSGRSERSRSRERGAWTRKSNGRSERSRSRDREDRDRRRKDENGSRLNGKPAMSEISKAPTSYSIDQYPSVVNMNPSTVRFEEHTMSGALDSHVPNQFPGQNPSTYTKSDFEPNPHGAAADYYNDKGQSVQYQPGERAFTPNPSSVAAPSGSTKPTKPAKSTKQSSSSSSSAKPSSKKSSRAVSPPASSAIIPAAAIGGAEAANHHMQARASTQYESSMISQDDFVHDRPAPSAVSGPTRYSSEPPPTVGAASSYYEQSELTPSMAPTQSGMYPSSQANKTGKYAAVGAAAAGMAAYGTSQHNQHSEYQEYTQHTQHTQNNQRIEYNDNSSRYGPPPSYGPQSQYGSQAPFTPERPGQYYDSAPGTLDMGMHHHHQHKGPMSRLKDGFLNLLSSPEDVAKMEEYTEYIGVCKHCFDPRSSPYAGPRKHHYHPKKKDSFETLRRRSYERMQRRRSDESLRRTNSKVQKENRYYSSDHKSSSNAKYMAGGLAVAGAATAGAAMFNDRKGFDDTYSVKSGHRASSAVRRRGSNSSFESTRRRTSRGRVSSGGYDEFITVRTKDGRVENRKVHRSRSGSTGRKSNWIGPAAGGAALGAVGAAAASRHRRRSSSDQESLRRGERRYRSRSSSRSHSPGLGEIFGFTDPKPRRSRRRSPFGSYQDSRKEQQKRKEKGGFFTFSNGSASSSESGMAFGDLNGSTLSRRSSGRSTKSNGKRKVSKKSSDEKLNATLLGIGATAAALTAAQKFSKSPKPGRRPSLGARRDARVSQYGPDGHKQGPPGSSDEGEWVDELPSDASSDESALAFDDGNARRRLSSRPSMDSVGSSSSNDGLSAWGWRWGSKKQKDKKPRRASSPHHEQQAMPYMAPTGPPATDIPAGAIYDVHGRRLPSDVGLVETPPSSQAPMQFVDPKPLSDASSRHPSMPGAFEDPPLQSPQPIAPFQPAFTQGSPEDPLKPTAGPSSKPPMRRSASSPTRNSKGSFMGDAAFIGGAAVATAGIIASQNRKGSPGSVRFGLNDEQQKKFDREIREEREREDAERRRADRTRALKEEAERFAREEDEKRALAERKRRQQEEEERTRQRQIESNQREEAYRREQAEAVEKSRRRAEEERQAAEEERQRFNDRQIREELERKQQEREEKSRKKKSRSTNERSEDSPSSWKGPVAAGMAGAVAGAVLDGALHKQGREYDQEGPRSRDAYSTQTFEPTNEHSGAPITDDDLADPDFFKRKRSPADLRRYEELSDEKLEELTHEREDYYNMPAQSQKDFFMPKELLEKQAEGKERVADPYGDNEVDVYQTTGGEARHIQGGDFGRYGKAPVVHQNIPKLNVIAPTPPQSTAGSVRGDKSAPPSPLAEIRDAPDEIEEKARHVPGGFDDPVYSEQQQRDAADTQESAWEPPLSKKDKKKRDKAAKRESVFDSEPATPLEEVKQDEPAARSVSFDAPQEEFEAPVSKKDKKKKGKKDKQVSAFDDEPVVPAVVEAEPETMPPVEPPVVEEEFAAPLSKKDKKKKAKKGMSFEESEPTTPAEESTSADRYFVPEVSQDRSIDDFDPVAAAAKEVDDFQPLSKKDKKKKGKKSSTFEDSEPILPINEAAQPEPELVADAPQVEPESAWEPPLSKKEKKKREKEAKQGLSFDSSEPANPVNEPVEPLSESREIDAEPAWEPPLSKKEKKKREKEAKSASGLDNSEPGTPVNEPEQRDIDPVVQEEAAFEPPLSKKEKKKREKEAQRQSLALGDSTFETPTDRLNDPLVEQSRELDSEPLTSSQDVSAEPEWEPPLSKKEKKKREKEAQRQSMSLDDPEPRPATDDFGGVELEREAEADAPWEPPLSKKDKKKRDKEAKSSSFGDVAAAVMTTAGVAAIADAVSKSEDEDYSAGKKSKKDKKKSASFDESPHGDRSPSDMPGAWDESSSDAAKDPPVADRDIPRAATTSPSQETPVEDLWGSSDAKKSKKKKKRESGRFSEPAIGSPLRSEIAFDDYLGEAASANGETQSTGYGRGGRGPSYYDDDYPKTGSPRAMSPDDMAQSVVSAPGLERRKSSKSKSKRRSGAYDGPEDFDDSRSIRSVATEPATSSKKDKKGGLFGLFSRKSSDGDKRDQSFLGERVEDLPPLPLEGQTSAISASGQEKQVHGTPASAEAVDQAVTVDPSLQGASTAISYHSEPAAEGGNTDIWGDPMAGPSEQPDLGEDVWGDEEFADRPSLPREVVAEQSLESAAAEGATPSRTGGPMTNIQEDFDDWFGSTDPTPKAPLLIKGKKGKKAKKGKAGQAKSTTAPSSVAEAPPGEIAMPPTDSQEASTVSELLEAEQTKDIQTAEAKNQDHQHTESTPVEPVADAPSAGHVEELSQEQLSGRRPSLTPRPLSSTAIPLRFKPIPSSPSIPKERSLSFGSPIEPPPMSPLSATGSGKKPRPRSSEFREVRPLYLVSRNSKLEDVEEQLPGLPDSKPSSRASSVQGSEDWHSAAENISPQPDLFDSPGSRRGLTIDLDEANKYRTEDEIMDTADQTTPKASDFSQTALFAPKSHSKQVPQFYTWEDLAKDEEMHEAAARQAEGIAEPPSLDAGPAEGLGIDQAEEQTESESSAKTKKDKRKNKKKGLAAAALLAGGAALAMTGDKDDGLRPTVAEEPDASVAQLEQVSADAPSPDEKQDDQKSAGKIQDSADAAATEAPKEATTDAQAIVPDEAADDFFAPTTTKKSKKAKKNKKAQAASDEVGEAVPEEQAPAAEIPTEGTAAEYYAATEDAMAKEQETAAANIEAAETTASTAAEPAPAEDEWAALTTSKKGKKAKKGKKTKVDALAEPDPEQLPTSEREVASSSTAAVPDLAEALNPAASHEPSTSTEPAAELVPEKDAAAASSRGWFSWPWGAKKAAEEGLEVDPVTMQAREVPETAKDPALEAVEVKEPFDNLIQEKPAEMGLTDERALLADSKTLPGNTEGQDHAASDLPKSETVPSDVDTGTTTAKDTTSVNILPETEIVAEKQEAVASETPAEITEVAEDLWGAPTSKKKKGKKGKKSGQSTPLAVEELPEEAKVEEPEVVPKDPSTLQETGAVEGEALETNKSVDSAPAEDDSFWSPQPSKKKKGKKGKKADEVTDQPANTTIVEAEPATPGADQEQASAPEATSIPAATSTSWDDLVAEDVPLEVTPIQADAEVPAGSAVEPQEGGANDHGTSDPTAQESMQQATEPEVEDAWAALPSKKKKKGKKGKKAAEDIAEPSQNDVAQLTEAPLSDDAAKSLDTEPVAAMPSEQVEVSNEQPTADATDEQKTPADEQDTPAAEPEDFWTPQPKGKKGKKGKKARQELADETPVPAAPEDAGVAKDTDPEPLVQGDTAIDALPIETLPEPVPDALANTVQDDTLSTKDSEIKESVAESTGVSALPVETVPESTPDAAKEVVEDDLWGQPAKGKKAKKGKKKKGGLDVPGTPPPEIADNATESQPVASEDLPAETPRDVTPGTDAAPTPEQSLEQEAAPEDDWSSLMTSKKGKKAKKSKKAAAAEEPVAVEPEVKDMPDQVVDEPVSETTGVEPSLEQTTVDKESFPLPSETASDALPAVGDEQPKDKDVLPADLKAATPSDVVDGSGHDSTFAEHAVVPSQDIALPTTQDSLEADRSLVEDASTAAPAADTQETATAEDPVELEPVSTRKSKKDKKKNKKSKAVDLDEPSESGTLSAEVLPAAEESTQMDETGEKPETSGQEETKLEAEIQPAEVTSMSQANDQPAAEPLPDEQTEDFGSFSTKKSKKDKKKAKKGKATEIEDLPTPSTPQEGAATEFFDVDTAEPMPAAEDSLTIAPQTEDIATEPVPAIDDSPAVLPETEGAAADYYAGHPDNIETVVDRDLPTEQPVEPIPVEEPDTSSKKSKKDKKKAKKAAASSWDVQEPETPVAVDEEQALTAAVEDDQTKNVEPAEADPADEFGAVSAKSKKDKKKAKKAAAASSWDVPEEDTAPLPSEEEVHPPDTAEEAQLVEADPTDEFGAFSSKKSKKDKKKAKKNTSLDTVYQEDAIPADATIQPEVESKDIPGDASDQVSDPLAETTQLPAGEIDKDLPPDDTKVETAVSQASPDEDLSISTKKSKKDKKKAKKAKGAVFEDVPEQIDGPNDVPAEAQPIADDKVDAGEPRPDLDAPTTEQPTETMPTAPVDAPPVDDIGIAPAEPLVLPEGSTPAVEDSNVSARDAPAQEGTAPDVPQDHAVTHADNEAKADDFEAIPSKKSKKDKKKAKKGQSAFSAWDESEPATPVDEAPRDTSEALEKVEGSLQATEDAGPVTEAVDIADSPAPATENGPALVPESQATQDDADAFSAPTTKKSKKDKKKAKKGQAASWDESEVATPAIETPIDTTETATIDDEAPKTLDDAPTDDNTKALPETASEQPTVPEPSPAQDDTDYFGVTSTKKSKKDKKKAKKASAASPWEEEAAAADQTVEPVAEPAMQQTSNEQDTLEKQDRSVDAEQTQAPCEISAQPDTLDSSSTPFETPNETPFETPAETPAEMPAEMPAEEGGDAFGSFSAKKSKKDKKKGKKSQETDWQTEEAAPATPADQEAAAVTLGLDESAARQNEPAGDVVPPETTSEPKEADADDMWAAPTKKSKKDKKKAKKSQVEEEAVPVADSDAPIEIIASTQSEEPPVSSETALVTEPETLAAAEAPKEEDDAWGSISTKKSKKDKKKAKKSKAIEDDVTDDQPTVPAVEDTIIDAPALNDTNASENVTTAETATGGALKEPPSDPIAELTEAPNEMKSPDKLIVLESPEQETRDVQGATFDESKGNSGSTATSETPGQDIDFAATLAAGLADSGFDPNLVVDDPVFHRRASPPSGLAEADPEEVFTSSNKKKKKSKGKKANDASTSDPAVVEAPASAEAPDDFDAALTQSLKESGFDPSLLETAGSPSQEPTSATLKDDEEEFSFTKSNKKKKKGKKSLAEAEDASSPAAASPLNSEQQVSQDDAVKREQADDNLDSIVPSQAIEADREPEAPALDESQTVATGEPVEAGDEEWAAPSKSKKKGKKDKKKQDRSFDFDEPVLPVDDARQELAASDAADIQKEMDLAADVVPAEAPLATEGTAEEEWGAPSKKKKGKKGKKQQETDWEASDSLATPLETPAAAINADTAQDHVIAPEDSRDIASFEAIPSVSAEQSTQIADDEWAAPSKKEKGKKGKKQQGSDLPNNDASAPPAEDPAASVEAEQKNVDETPVVEAGPSPTDNALPAEPEAQAPLADDEWGLPSKKKKGKKGKKSSTSDWQENQEPETPELHEVTPATDAVDASIESTRDIAEPSGSAIDNSAASLEPVDAVETLTEEVQPVDTATFTEPVDDLWGAPSKKKKGKKGKKGIAVELPDENTAVIKAAGAILTAEDTTSTDKAVDASDPVASEAVDPEVATGDTTAPSDKTGSFVPIEKVNTEIVEEQPDTTANTTELQIENETINDEWAAPSKKKDKKNKKKKAMDWLEPDNASQEAPRDLTEEATTAPAETLDESGTLARGADVGNESGFVHAIETAPVVPALVEAVADEWAAPSKKKKGKKGKKDQDPWSEPETPTADNPIATPDVAASEDVPAVHSEVLSGDVDGSAAESPAPAETALDNWDLPVKKKGKKGKKAQLWSEEEPVSEPKDSTNVTTEPVMGHEPEVSIPIDRGLVEESQPKLTPAVDAIVEQPSAIPDEEWGTSNKKKGKKSKKKGAASDADLDPFISTPADSAPISTTDTAEASAVEEVERTAGDSFQPPGEMDIDEMDKAYKAYKKNKRKQKKLQAASGDDNGLADNQTSEQSSEQKPSASRGLDIQTETEPARQPSPLASGEPTWSFAKLEDDKASGDTSRRLSKVPSHGSLTSRRSLEPLHVDTASPPVTDAGAAQKQEEQQHGRPGSAHGRTASRDTPLEPTSRQRASYLFQSPAPFSEAAPDNTSILRTPEQRGDASDYFHSRGVDSSTSAPADEPLSPSAGLMSPKSALHPIPEESAAHKRSLGDATNITPMEPAGKMLRRTETPKAIREQSLLSSTSRDGPGSTARSVSNPISALGPFDDDRTAKRVVSDTRSPSAMSNRSAFSAHQHVSPEDRRTLSRASNRSSTPTLRRTNLSGDLRAASRTSNRRGDTGSAVGAQASPKTIPFQPPPTPPLNDEDELDPGATRAAGMAETFQGYGGQQASQVSPTRPPSMRKRQSMHVMDLESKLEQLTSENRALQEAQQNRGMEDVSFDTNSQALQQTLEARELELREKNNEIQHIQAMLEPMQQELNRLVQINNGLTEANRNLVDDTNGRYATLQNEHANVTQQWQSTTRELEDMRQEHSRLSNGMRDAVAAQLSTALAEKDHEIRKLKDELAEASERIRALQVQIQSSKTTDFLNLRDEDYFDGACQKLCQHVQQWVLRFSKMSDNRICRLSSDLKDEKIEARLDNALLDGMDVDKLLGDRVRRRDVFMSVVMTMVWEYVFTRYLFGMDREQRQKLKALEKTLSEVGPPRAVAQWRATTLTLLSKRPSFSKQCALDTEAVAHEIFGVLSALLTPPSGSEQQLLTSLTKVITVAVNLSVEMRTQRSEYIMLPPLQPEYDTNGDLVRKVHFNASLMNERSGLFTSNEALEAERAVVKIVLFPLVVKKGDEYGEGEEEIVVCPAQVLVHNDSGKSRKVVRVMSGAMEIDDPRRSRQSLLSGRGSMQF